MQATDCSAKLPCFGCFWTLSALHFEQMASPVCSFEEAVVSLKRGWGAVVRIHPTEAKDFANTTDAPIPRGSSTTQTRYIASRSRRRGTATTESECSLRSANMNCYVLASMETATLCGFANVSRLWAELVGGGKVCTWRLAHDLGQAGLGALFPLAPACSSPASMSRAGATRRGVRDVSVLHGLRPRQRAPAPVHASC